MEKQDKELIIRIIEQMFTELYGDMNGYSLTSKPTIKLRTHETARLRNLLNKLKEEITTEINK